MMEKRADAGLLVSVQRRYTMDRPGFSCASAMVMAFADETKAKDNPSARINLLEKFIG